MSVGLLTFIVFLGALLSFKEIVLLSLEFANIYFPGFFPFACGLLPCSFLFFLFFNLSALYGFWVLCHNQKCIIHYARYVYYAYALYIIQIVPVVSSGSELVWFLILHLTDSPGVYYGVRQKASFMFSRWPPSCPSAICWIIHLFPSRFEISSIICCISHIYLGLLLDYIWFPWCFYLMNSLSVSLDTFQSLSFFVSHLFFGFPTQWNS